MDKAMPTRRSPDPLIDEVRQIREAISRECDYDLNKQIEQLRELQDKQPARIVRRPDSGAANTGS